MIWPFLADSITMAVVQSAIDDLDHAMDDYVGQDASSGCAILFALFA